MSKRNLLFTDLDAWVEELEDLGVPTIELVEVMRDYVDMYDDFDSISRDNARN